MLIFFKFFMRFRFQMRMFTFLFNISQTYLTIITHLLQLNKMNIKTNLLEEYVNFVDTTKKRNEKLWIYTIILVFLLIILTIIRVFKYLNE